MDCDGAELDAAGAGAAPASGQDGAETVHAGVGMDCDGAERDACRGLAREFCSTDHVNDMTFRGLLDALDRRGQPLDEIADLLAKQKGLAPKVVDIREHVDLGCPQNVSLENLPQYLSGSKGLEGSRDGGIPEGAGGVYEAEIAAVGTSACEVGNALRRVLGRLVKRLDEGHFVIHVLNRMIEKADSDRPVGAITIGQGEWSHRLGRYFKTEAQRGAAAGTLWLDDKKNGPTGAHQWIMAAAAAEGLSANFKPCVRVVLRMDERSHDGPERWRRKVEERALEFITAVLVSSGTGAKPPQGSHRAFCLNQKCDNVPQARAPGEEEEEDEEDEDLAYVGGIQATQMVSGYDLMRLSLQDRLTLNRERKTRSVEDARECARLLSNLAMSREMGKDDGSAESALKLKEEENKLLGLKARADAQNAQLLRRGDRTASGSKGKGSLGKRKRTSKRPQFPTSTPITDFLVPQDGGGGVDGTEGAADIHGSGGGCAQEAPGAEGVGAEGGGAVANEADETRGARGVYDPHATSPVYRSPILCEVPQIVQFRPPRETTSASSGAVNRTSRGEPGGGDRRHHHGQHGGSVESAPAPARGRGLGDVGVPRGAPFGESSSTPVGQSYGSGGGSRGEPGGGDRRHHDGQHGGSVESAPAPASRRGLGDVGVPRGERRSESSSTPGGSRVGYAVDWSHISLCQYDGIGVNHEAESAAAESQGSASAGGIVTVPDFRGGMFSCCDWCGRLTRGGSWRLSPCYRFLRLPPCDMFFRKIKCTGHKVPCKGGAAFDAQEQAQGQVVMNDQRVADSYKEKVRQFLAAHRPRRETSCPGGYRTPHWQVTSCAWDAHFIRNESLRTYAEELRSTRR